MGKSELCSFETIVINRAFTCNDFINWLFTDRSIKGLNTIKGTG